MAWMNYKFGDFVDSNPKISIKKGEFVEPCEMEDINPSHKHVYPREPKLYKGSNSKFQNGDTVFARITPCLENGKIAQIKGLKTNKGIGSTEFFVFRGKKNVSDSDFIFYLSKSNLVKDTAVNSMTGASGRQRADLKAVRKLELTVPDLPIQKRIASILSAYDDLIEVNNQHIQVLEETARELYKEWFVRMRFPGYKKAKFEKGIPTKWKIESLSTHIGIVRGKSYTSEEISDDSGENAFINLKNMKRGGGFRLDGTKYFTGKFKKEQLVYPGDIVMAVTDMTQDRLIVGRVARVPLTEHKEYVISLDITKIVPLQLPSDFIYSTLRFNYYGEHIAQFANGTNVLHLNPELLKKESILVPEDDLIKRFVNIVKPIYEQVDILAIQNEQLRQIRDRLLPRLISGKLEVKVEKTKKEKATV